MRKHVTIHDSMMDMTGDLASSWEFFNDSWKNLGTARKQGRKDKKIVVASIMGKECLHVAEIFPWPKMKDKYNEA